MIRSSFRPLALALFLALTCGAALCAEDGETGMRTGGLLRVHLDYPAKVSLAFGVIAARMPSSYDCRTSCLYHGMTVQGAAGLGAGELAIGYGSVVGETAPGDWLLRRVFVGYGVRAAVLRTWSGSWVDPHGATFFGVEGAATIAQVGMRLGLFRRTDPVEGEQDWRVFGGLGWSF